MYFFTPTHAIRKITSDKINDVVNKPRKSSLTKPITSLKFLHLNFQANFKYQSVRLVKNKEIELACYELLCEARC